MKVNKIISAAIAAIMCFTAPQYFSNNCSEPETVTTAVAADTSGLKFYEPNEIYNYSLYLEKVRDLQKNGTYSHMDNGFFLCDINADDMPEFVCNF